jgi:hypothetical protein
VKRRSILEENNYIDSHRAVAMQILQYLIEHPEAKDTVEGIIDWWLPGGSIIWEIRNVQEALDFFVSRGWVVEREITPSTRIYGVNSDQLEELKLVLTKLMEEEEGAV